MAGTKIPPGRARVTMKLRTSTVGIDLTGATLPEKVALAIYRMVISGRSMREVVDDFGNVVLVEEHL